MVPPIWISSHGDIKLLQRAWQTEFEKRAAGGAIALAGFHYQFLVTLHDTVRAWLDRPTIERGRPSIFTECLSDILDQSSNEVILVTQIKLTRRSESLKDALTELWLIYQLALRTTPSLCHYLRFRILSRQTELKEFEKALSRWQPNEPPESDSTLEEFCSRVTVQLFHDPEDEILALLANNLRVSDPVGYVQRWLGKLLGAASKEGAASFEEAAQSIWNDLQLLQNSSIDKPPSVYVWTSQDKAPDQIQDGDVLTGERPHVHHLRQGYFAGRTRVYNLIFERACEWISPVDPKDKQLRLPVFWIGGRSGSGKSVALLHLLSMLYESGIGSILWLGNKTELLKHAVAWALKLANQDRQVIIGIDDPYAPNTQGDDILWKEALAMLEAIRQGGDLSALPSIVCCGPSEQAERMQRDLPEEINVTRTDLTEHDQKDIPELQSWYTRRTKKLPPNLSDKNVLLVQLFFEWETGQSIPEFASRFRNRIRENDRDGILERLISKMLLVNSVYVGYPAKAVDAYLTPDLQDAFQRLREEHHIARDLSDRGVGLWLAHAHLSHVIYESWYPARANGAVRADHLKKVIADAIEFGLSPSEKMAPLWSISNIRFRGTDHEGRLDEQTVTNLLGLVYESRTSDTGQRLQFAELPVWIQIRTYFPNATLNPDPVNEALNRIKPENWSETGLRLTCHKLLQHLNSFSEEQRSSTITTIAHLLAKAPSDWHEWAPIANDVYRRTRSPELVGLICEWVNKNSRSQWANRLFARVFSDNVTDPKILNVARGLLPRVGDEKGWGDIAIQLVEEAKRTLPLSVLQWGQNNHEKWGACFLLESLLKHEFAWAMDWALKWCKRWHMERSANYVLEPLLVLMGPDQRLKTWSIRWIRADHWKVNDAFLMEKIITTFPWDSETQSVTSQWVENHETDKSWVYVWNALFRAKSEEAVRILEAKTQLICETNTTSDQFSKDAGLEVSSGLEPTKAHLAEAWYSIGIALRKSEREAEAIPAFQNTVALQPHLVKGWQALGAAYSVVGENKLALDAVIKAAELLPDDALAWHNLGIAYGKVERYVERIAALKRATELDPNFPKAWQALGAAYDKVGEKDLARQATLKLVELKPSDGKSWYYAAVAYGRVHNYEEQIAALIKATELKPLFVKSWQMLGGIYNKLGHTELALAAALKVIELRPNHAEPWYHLSIAYGKIGNSEQQIAALLKAIELNPQFAEAWQRLGAVYNKLGQINLALTASRKLTELKPDSSDSWGYLAIAHGKAGQPEEQIAALRKAIELQPDSAKAWKALATVYSQRGQTDLAVAAGQKLTELRPDDAEAWYYLAIAYGNREHSEDQIAALLKVTELNPEFPEAWQRLGTIYQKSGQAELAVAAKARFAQLRPDDA